MRSNYSENSGKDPSDNRLSKYLLYAIGEIVLVVIDILLAIKINNWNEERKDCKREIYIKSELHHEFIANKSQFTGVVNSYAEKLNSSRKIRSMFSIIPRMTNMDSLAVFMDDMLGSRTFNPSHATIETLINSADFEKIKNNELRSLLVTWVDMCKD